MYMYRKKNSVYGFSTIQFQAFTMGDVLEHIPQIKGHYCSKNFNLSLFSYFSQRHCNTAF